jgi:hypothetical protein
MWMLTMTLLTRTRLATLQLLRRLLKNVFGPVFLDVDVLFGRSQSLRTRKG